MKPTQDPVPPVPLQSPPRRSRLANSPLDGRGFDVACIRCGQAECVAISAHDVSCFHCAECDESFNDVDVRECLDGWSRLLEWLGTSPVNHN